MPFGLALFSNFVKEDQKNLFWWLPGLILSVAPAIILLISLIIGVFRKQNKKDSIFNLIIKKTPEEKIIKTIRTPDPTSIEFRSLFRSIMDKALKESKRKLIIVLDNLDRITPEEAKSIWSTMRTFFDPESPQKPEWISRFWLLVPFDNKTAERLWDIKETGDSGLAQAFIEKTFQSIYYVPPPVLSNWHEFFIEQLKIAFPDHASKEEDLHAIFNIFRQKVKELNRPPTPRDIKLFINKIGSFHRIWEDKIPISAQAGYALIADKIKNPEEDFFNPAIISDDIIRIHGEEIRKWLSALHFNVEPDVAIQVLIREPVINALENGDSEGLKKLKCPGFIECCENIITRDKYNFWIVNQPDKIANIAIAIEGAEINLCPSILCIWDYLGRALTDSIAKMPINDKVVEGIAIIYKQYLGNAKLESDKSKFIETLLSGLSKNEPQKVPNTQKPNEKTLQDWILGICHLIEIIHKDGYGDLIDKNFTLRINYLKQILNKGI